jgi:hypothetical protein
MFEHVFSEHNHIYIQSAILMTIFFTLKKLYQHQQVHDQEDTVNLCYRSISAFSSKIFEATVILSLFKLAFNRNPLPIFLSTLRLQTLHLVFVFGGDHRWASQWLAGKSYIALLQKAAIVARTICRSCIQIDRLK